MMRALDLRLAALALVPIASLAACSPRPSVRSLDAGRFGRVSVFEPVGRKVAFVLLFEDGSSRTAERRATVRTLAEAGATVVVVDLARYLAGLAASDDGCHYVVAEIEDLSRRLERELGYESYYSPILAGAGEGGTLAYAALAQAPAATIAGAVSVDPTPELGTRVPFCPGATATAVPGGGFSYSAKPGMHGWWRVSSRQPLPSDLAALVAIGDGGRPDGESTEGRLLGLLLHALDAEPQGPRGLQDLPLIEVSAPNPGETMAVVYSGDGGWRDLDKQVSEILAAHGVPVVGVDCLRYFWREKTPSVVAQDLDRILQHYLDRWRAREVLLVGYSFGAGVVPFAFNRLPQEQRARVAQISLLGLERTAAFEFHVSAWFGPESSSNGLAVLPELLRIDLERLQCVYGEAETDTLCPDPALARAELIETSGGHHFDGDYEALAQRILAGAERRRLAPHEDSPASAAEETARGDYLARAGDCYSCHTSTSDAPYGGGRRMDTPFGYLLAPNLTPDPETGIGRWSADDFYRALHDGVNRRGQDMFPAMPYDFYTKVTRQDADAIYAYLRTVKPVRNVVAVNHLHFPFNQRWSMAVWRELYFTDGTFEEDPGKSAAWNRGAYLVEGLGHCGACHSPRTALGGVEREKALTGAAVDGWFALDLTPSLHAGLGAWTADEIATYLKTGVNENKTTAVGPMAEVVQNSTSYLSDVDLLAMAEYLKSLPASSSLRAARVVPAESRERGATLYMDYCSGCHRAKGRGTPGVSPALAGNDAVVAQDAGNILKVVLGGAPQQGRYVAMPGFADQLSDEQIADIANYARTSWGNDAAPNVTPKAVAALRRSIPDASGPAPAAP